MLRKKKSKITANKLVTNADSNIIINIKYRVPTYSNQLKNKIYESMTDLNKKLVWFGRGEVYVRRKRGQNPITINSDANIARYSKKLNSDQSKVYAIDQ